MPFISHHLTDNYATSPFSQYVRALRNFRNDTSGVNYATFWIAAGFLILPVSESSNNYHSEKEVWCILNQYGPYNQIAVPNWVTGQAPGANQTPAAVSHLGFIGLVYTEREPCGTCTPFLNDVLLNGVYVCWHFPYVSPETSKYKHDDETTARLVMDSQFTYHGDNQSGLAKQSRNAGNAEHRQTMGGQGTTWSVTMPPPLSLVGQVAMKVGA